MNIKPGYSVAVSDEYLGDGAPVLFQGGLNNAIKYASNLGFDSVEIHIREPKKFNAEELSEIALKNKITISAIGTGLEYSINGLTFTSPDKKNREQMAIRMKEHIDLAAKLNAVVFLGLCRGKAPRYSECNTYMDILADELVPIASYAKDRNVILGLEPIAFYYTNLINTTQEALDFISKPGLETIELLLDTHHMYIEDKDIEEAFRISKGKIAHVHISDSNRQYPGSGNVDYKKVAKILKEIGYQRTISLEILARPTAEQAALNGLNWMKENWS